MFGIQQEQKCQTEMLDKEVKTENQPYTKTDINRMRTADLQKLAGEKGIENADSFSGEDLKKILIELMNL